MNGIRILFAFALASLVAVAVQAGPPAQAVRMAPRDEVLHPKEKHALAVIEGSSGSEMVGKAVFIQKDGVVTLQVTVEKAPSGKHAIHLHERGDCSAPDASSAGPHWNPTGHDHGQWGNSPFHLGDIGNVDVGEDGKGVLTITTDLWSIGDKPANDVDGKSIVVHAGVDDFKTQPTGNSGVRIGCGIVRMQP